VVSAKPEEQNSITSDRATAHGEKKHWAATRFTLITDRVDGLAIQPFYHRCCRIVSACQMHVQLR